MVKVASAFTTSRARPSGRPAARIAASHPSSVRRACGEFAGRVAASGRTPGWASSAARSPWANCRIQGIHESAGPAAGSASPAKADSITRSTIPSSRTSLLGT
jgi:hypothetical protein